MWKPSHAAGPTFLFVASAAVIMQCQPMTSGDVCVRCGGPAGCSCRQGLALPESADFQACAQFQHERARCMKASTIWERPRAGPSASFAAAAGDPVSPRPGGQLFGHLGSRGSVRDGLRTLRHFSFSFTQSKKTASASRGDCFLSFPSIISYSRRLYNARSRPCDYPYQADLPLIIADVTPSRIEQSQQGETVPVRESFISYFVSDRQCPDCLHQPATLATRKPQSIIANRGTVPYLFYTLIYPILRGTDISYSGISSSPHHCPSAEKEYTLFCLTDSINSRPRTTFAIIDIPLAELKELAFLVQSKSRPLELRIAWPSANTLLQLCIEPSMISATASVVL